MTDDTVPRSDGPMVRSDRLMPRWDGVDVTALARELGVERVEAHGRIGSTNDRAAELAREGAPSWTVVVADEQTAGRGRRGADWISPPGTGLWMSILVRGVEPSLPLPLLVGLACAEAIEELLPTLRVGVKWPNDLLVGGRKVGGILCESAAGAVVVGVGINVARSPVGSDVRRPPSSTEASADHRARRPDGGPERSATLATALEMEACKPLERSALAYAMVERMRARLGAEGTLGGALVDLRDRDVLAGLAVDTEQEGPGRATGIDDSGALLLARSDGRTVRVVSGGVRFSRAGS